MDDKYLTVSRINHYIKYKLDNDQNLQKVYLKGEISNFKNHTSGHFYFTLKDENSRILAVMFRSAASKVNFTPADGMNVLVTGRISCYEANGNYQIYVEEMLEDGVGNLYVEFEKLKKKLGERGYFDEKYKKPIPKFPKRIGVITASTGAAIRDIITTINRRYRLAEIILIPTLVQGERAGEDIVSSLDKAKDLDLDVIILGRGGGSIEDLWAFNEEIVADAIFNMDIPIISAVGHEIDFTISDFVSDLRAPTPTAAAELAVPNTIDLINNINQIKTRLSKSILNKLELNKNKLNALLNSYILKNPKGLYEIKMQKLDNLIDKLNIYMEGILENKETKYVSLLDKMEALNPIKTLKRGYSITRANNKVVNLKDIKESMIITTEFSEGEVISKVMEVKDGK
ncbi:MAG: exodeoxyribonuclease VII large subunit [Bacilli bacterium]